MRRDKEWKFDYRAKDVLDGAKKKLAHHNARLRWWSEKQDLTMATVKAEGIEIDESLANMVSASYQRGPSVQIRNDLVKDLQECVMKIREHRGAADEYDAWVQVLSAQAEHVVLPLDQDDWMYFFGRTSVPHPGE